MKKVHLEIVFSIAFVLGGTFLAYTWLESTADFWDAQFAWSTTLLISWIMVAVGYYYQGWMIHHEHSSVNVSAVLPSIVFVVQCILFVKGIFFSDWSLTFGAVIVNSGVVFYLYQVMKIKRIWFH